MQEAGCGKSGSEAAAALNPNWANLQQKLKASRHPKSSPNSAHLDYGIRSTSTLGKRKERPGSEPAVPPSSSSILTPTSEDFRFSLSLSTFLCASLSESPLGSLTEALAMDCEMVGVSFHGNKSALGRVTLVNTSGNVVYDEYVRPLEYVVDFRTKISGIRPKNLKKAKEFMAVQKNVAEMISGRILIGHALHNDLKVLLLTHPRKDIRDTAEYKPFLREGRKRALKDLAAEILGVKIQQKEHCPIEDARAAMLIYKKHKKEWEKNNTQRVRFKKKHNKKHRKKSVLEQATQSDVQQAS